MAVLIAGACLVAQNTRAADQPSNLEEVVVTAQFRTEKLQDTPIAISAVTSQDIEQRALTNTYEVAYTVPNASFRPAQAAFGNTMTAYIRGVGQYDFDQAFEPGVGIYVDDVYQPFTLGTQMDLLDMDRVEVLRGPQGTLFGRGSIGGVVRLITKQAEGTDKGSIDITTGSFSRIDVRAGYDFKLTDSVFARVTGVSRHSDGYQSVVDFACANPAEAGLLPVQDPGKGRNCVVGSQGGISFNGARGQLRILASDSVDLNFALDYEDDSSEAKADTLLAIQYPRDLSGNLIPTNGYNQWNTEYAMHVPCGLGPPQPACAGGAGVVEQWGYGIPYDNRFLPPNPYTTYATYNDPKSGLSFKPTSALRKVAGSAKLEWKISEAMKFETILAYTDLKSQISSDTDASPMNLQLTGGQQNFSWGTEEVRLTGHAPQWFNWTVGAFLYQGYAANYQVVSFPPILWGILRNAVGLPPSVVESIIDGPSKYSVNTRNVAHPKAYAGYANGTFALTDKLSLDVGLRESKDKKDVSFDNTFVQAPINIDASHFDWKLGLDYKVTSDVLVYGSVATGYRPPAYNPRPFTPSQAVAVGGEEMTAYELGVKADLFDKTLRTNVAVFYSDYNKRILPIGGTECIPPYVAANTPGAVQDSAGLICLATTSLTSYRQVKGGKVKGAEFEGTWRPISPLTVNASFGYTDWSSPELDNCDFNGDGKPDAGVTCSRLPVYVPKYNWSAGLGYDIGLSSGSKVTPRVDAYGQSQICSSVTSALSCTSGYTLVNVRLQWTAGHGGWMAAAGGTNIGNKQYYLNTFDLTPFGQNTVEGQPGRPAEWYVTLSRKF